MNKKPYIGPLDKALYDAMAFTEGMTQAYFISNMLKQIDSLTALLEDDNLEEKHREITETLLKELEDTFYQTIIAKPEEDTERGRKNF